MPLNYIVAAPFGYADSQSPAYAAILALNVKNHSTFLKPAQYTGNQTINLTIDPNVVTGAVLTFEPSFAGAQVITFGTGFIAPAMTGVAAKTFVQRFVFDGTNYVPEAAAFQIN